MGSKVSKMGEEFLIAAAGGQEAVVRLLLEKGANATAMNITGQTALDAAKAKGHRAVMRLLQSANQVRFSVENTEERFTIHLHHDDDDGHQHQPNRADQPIYSLPTDTPVIFTFEIPNRKYCIPFNANEQQIRWH
jgi:ankyrin repeat protein